MHTQLKVLVINNKIHVCFQCQGRTCQGGRGHAPREFDLVLIPNLLTVLTTGSSLASQVRPINLRADCALFCMPRTQSD